MEFIFSFIFPLALYGLIVAGIRSSIVREAGKRAHQEFLRCNSYGDFFTALQSEEEFYDEQIKAHEAHLRTLSPPQRIELGR